MVSRRNGLKFAALFPAATLGRIRSGVAQAPTPTARTSVAFAIPPGACDCHVHVFPDPQQFPFWTGRVYTPPTATADELLALQHALHMDRVVIVTPSVYGTDNAATLDGMRQLGPERARGVAVIAPAPARPSWIVWRGPASAASASTWSRPASSILRPPPGGCRTLSNRSATAPGTCRFTRAYPSSPRSRRNWRHCQCPSCSITSPARSSLALSGQRGHRDPQADRPGTRAADR